MAELEKRYTPKLEELTEQLRNSPSNDALYVERAHLYAMMYRSLIAHRAEGLPLIEKALADYSAAINLRPSAAAYLGRASCTGEILWTVRHPRMDQPKEVVEFFLQDELLGRNFSDLQNAARLSANDEERCQALIGLAQLHSWRAKSLATPAMMAAIHARHGESYSVWDDFDQALEFTRQGTELLPERNREGYAYRGEGMVGVYGEIGRAAFALGEYDRAVSAFQSGEKYLTGRFMDLCEYYAIWGGTYVKKGYFPEAIDTYTKALNLSERNCRYVLERRGDAFLAQGRPVEALADYTALLEGSERYPGSLMEGRLPIKRARVYFALQEPRKALADINFAMERAYLHTCPRALLLRARAYRLLGNLPEAVADEQLAAQFQPAGNCLNLYREQF